MAKHKTPLSGLAEVATDQLAEIHRLREINAELLAALDPDTLDAIADELGEFEHSARRHSLSVLARDQRAAIAKATQ